METLAVVAYRQPVLRADVEAIRGVGCSEVLKQLMEIELVRISAAVKIWGVPTFTEPLTVFYKYSDCEVPIGYPEQIG